ncbi:Uncharacterized protein GBIM_04609 [Gryllus bimaculatus]|nr:Uncharacterized protein GBIM_04609 [Gryllus bimaculatus]
MSHNRRMFGGRPGGPGGPVSPWEGGVVPGQGRPASAGILGAAPQPLNLLSQLSTPEAQLALASNLLTSLLGQQQQQAAPMPQPRVPPGPQPLLSMNATPPGRGFFPRPDNMKGGGPMRQQRGRGNRFPDNYNKQQRGGNRMRPNAPINKRGGVAGGQQRTQRKSGGSTPNKSSSGEKKAESEKTSPIKAENEAKKDDSEVSKNDTKEEEEDEEAEEGKKRDWKDEKNKKDASMDVEDEQEDKDDKEAGSKGGKGATTKEGSSPAKGGAGKDSDASRYANIPKELLVCHICNKNMWDGQSFENHLRGKSHQMMMDQTEKTYKVQVKLMRQELKLAEEKREIEMERVQRFGKKVNIKPREYCTMCDLYFFGNIMGHRKNGLHQNLKNFLHPRCLLCSQEFPSRTEWDHHQLTPMHLVKLTESQKNEGKDSAEVAMVVEDEPAPADDSDEKAGEGAEPAAGEGGSAGGEGDAAGGDDAKAASGAGGEPGDGKAAAGGSGAAGAGAAGAKKPIGRQTVPPYDPKKSYGTHLLKKVLGYTTKRRWRTARRHRTTRATRPTSCAREAPRPPGRRAPRRAKRRPPRPLPQPGRRHRRHPRGEDGGRQERGGRRRGGRPDGKRVRREAVRRRPRLGGRGSGAAKGAAGEAEAAKGDAKGAQEQGADSTTENDGKSEERDSDAGRDEPEEAQTAGGGAEPATNGVAGEDAAEGQDEGGDEAADEEEADKGDKAAPGEEDAMDAEDEPEPVPAPASASSSPSKGDTDKKFSGGGQQANRRGMGRGLGRGRGRGHRRSHVPVLDIEADSGQDARGASSEEGQCKNRSSSKDTELDLRRNKTFPCKDLQLHVSSKSAMCLTDSVARFMGPAITTVKSDLLDAEEHIITSSIIIKAVLDLFSFQQDHSNVLKNLY